MSRWRCFLDVIRSRVDSGGSRLLTSLAAVATVALAAPASCLAAGGGAERTYTVSAPVATPGVAYAEQLALPRMRGSAYTYRSVGPLPQGIALSPAGLLSGTPVASTSRSHFTVELAPLRGRGTAVIRLRLDLAVMPAAAPGAHGRDPTAAPAPGATFSAFAGGGAVAALDRLAAAQAAALPLTGLIGCWSMPGCNTSTTVAGGDGAGHPLTEWAREGTADTGCTSPNGDHPQWLENTATGSKIGAYIDNEVDPFGAGTAERQYLVDCVYAQGYGVILIGMYPSETSTYFLLPNGNGFAGGMLEWYPYCDGGYASGYLPATRNPPQLHHTMASGYIVQDRFDNECEVGPSPLQSQAEWSYAWGQVDADGADGIYNDLLASY